MNPLSSKQRDRVSKLTAPSSIVDAAPVSRMAGCKPHVAIAICTFHRQEGLQRALDGLWKQTGILSMDVTVLVVDNDPAGSAGPIVERNLPPPGWSLRYVIEPRPGVSHARNRCLAEANADFIAFIDDDEVPEPNWLAALLETQRNTGADAVFGSVISRYETMPPAWMSDCGAHKNSHHPTGSEIGWENCYTANVLLSHRIVTLAGGSFDSRFAITGGEDTLFFARPERAGAKLIWCDEAVVFEDIPPSRLRLAWILRRSFKGGQTWVRIRAESNRAVWLPMALRGAIFALIAAGALLPTFLISRGAAVRQAQRVAGGLGKMTAWWPAVRAKRGGQSGHYVG